MHYRKINIETIAVEKSGPHRKSALMHTLAAGDATAAAVKLAADRITGAYRKVI